MTDIAQLKIAMFFTEFQGCKSALKVCVDLFAMKQTPLLKRIRSALKLNKREMALSLMKYWLSIYDKKENEKCLQLLIN